MTTRVAINGLGRIGRCVLRAYAEYGHEDVEIVAVNSRGPVEQHMHLLKYDSTHGVFPGDITGDEGSITIGGKTVRVFREREPELIPWQEEGVDIVLECTGVFRSKEEASRHIQAGAKKVLVSAPSPDADATIVYGVNNDALKAEHTVISAGSCTTNCLAPVAKVLHEAIGIESGFMTTIHAYTSDQNILDNAHKDLRRARTAALSMIPTSTGAAKALGLVLPQLAGKLDGTAIRVPTSNVSMVDLVFNASRATDKGEVHKAINQAAAGAMKGVLAVNSAPLVSIDFNHNPHSSVFDATQTFMTGEKLCRVVSWYDNEWGFSCRMLDVAALAGNI